MTWYAIVADSGAVLGHASFEVVHRLDGRDIIETQEIYVREQGGQPTRTTSRTVTTHDAAGRTLSITETTQTPRFSARTEARIEGNQVHVARETPSSRWAASAPITAATRFDAGEALLRRWDGASPLAFDNFSIDAGAVERVVIEPLHARDAEGRLTALRTHYDGDALRVITRLTIDRDGRIVESAQPMFGATIRMLATDRASALRPHPPYQIVPNMMTRSPFRISAPASRGHMRYRLAFRGDIVFAPPTTGEQRAHAEAGVLTIDVCDTCGGGLSADAANLADAMRATPWLQSDHPRLREIAAPVGSLDVSDTRKMELLLERARPYIEHMDFSGHYSALDTITRRAGDCTEAAVLLAALGRAAGIPTRVASGLTYSRASYHGVSNAFTPHSWTLAYVDGQWRSFDLALDEFDSTHIALTVGDGEPRSIAAAGQLASLVRLDSLAEVRARDRR